VRHLIVCRVRIIDPETPACDRADGRFFSDLAQDTRFVLVRHGQSEGNARQIVQGRLDLPLDAEGRAQAAALGKWVAGFEPDLMLCSPLARAAETADIVAAACRDTRPGSTFVGPRREALFSELDVGPFTGLGMDEAERRYPEAFAAFNLRSWDGVPGAETSAALYARALEAWALLRGEARKGARRVVVVSHGGFIQWLIKTTMGVREWMPLVKTSNCGVSEFALSPQGGGGGVLAVWERIDFLPPGLRVEVRPLF